MLENIKISKRHTLILKLNFTRLQLFAADIKNHKRPLI